MKPEKIRQQFRYYLTQAARELNHPKQANRLPSRERLLAENQGDKLRRTLHLCPQEAYDGYTNSRYFERMVVSLPSPQPLSLCYQLKQGGDAAKAITDLLGNPRTVMLLNDQGKINLIQYIAMLSVLIDGMGESQGKRYFNLLFADKSTRLILSSFSAIEGVLGNCTHQHVINAPNTSMSKFFEKTYHQQFHPDNEADDYIFEKGDIVYFNNHPGYRARHPLGATAFMVGICVKPGKVDEAPLFMIPRHYQQSLLLADIKRLLVQAYNQPTPAWTQRAWTREYHPPVSFVEPLPSITEDDLGHYIRPYSMTIDAEFFCKVMSNPRMVRTLSVKHTYQQKHMQRIRNDTLSKRHVHIAKIVKYIQDCSHAYSSTSDKITPLAKEQAGHTLDVIKPLLDQRGLFSMSLEQFSRTAPIADCLQACIVINCGFSIRMIATKKPKEALPLLNDVVSFYLMLCDFLNEDEEAANTIFLSIAVAERSIADCYKAMRKPLKELSHLQSCYALREKRLGEHHPNTIEVKARIDALRHIQQEQKNILLTSGCDLLEHDQESLMQGGVNYALLDHNNPEKTATAIKQLGKARKYCASAEAALILGTINQENIFQLIRVADQVPPGVYAAATQHLSSDTMGRQLQSQGLLESNNMSNLQSQPSCESNLSISIQSCLRHCADAYYYCDITNTGLLKLIDSHFKALLMSVSLAQFEDAVTALDGPELTAVHCIASCYYARALAAQKGLVNKSRALSVISGLWDNIDDAFYHTTLYPATFKRMQEWSLQMAEAFLRSINKIAPDTEVKTILSQKLYMQLRKRNEALFSPSSTTSSTSHAARRNGITLFQLPKVNGVTSSSKSAPSLTERRNH